MQKYLTILFFFAVSTWSAKPMESLTNYNVIMVHGAADAGKGMKNAGVNENVCGNQAYGKYGGVWGSADMMGKAGYKNGDEDDRPIQQPAFSRLKWQSNG